MGVGVRARRAFAGAGMKGVWYGALGTGLYRRLLVLERLLEAPAADVAAADRLRVVELDDARAYRLLRPDQPLEEFTRRRASGAICFAAILGDRVAGATWARRGGGRCEYLEREVLLGQDDVYLFDTMVHPAQRGRRIAPRIAAEQIRVFRERGLARIVATVLPENRASLRARSRNGFLVCGQIGWVGLGCRRRHFARGFAPRPIGSRT
jgi:ribosomal protein S18 acetylase RimI-like enzyme